MNNSTVRRHVIKTVKKAADHISLKEELKRLDRTPEGELSLFDFSISECKKKPIKKKKMF